MKNLLIDENELEQFQPGDSFGGRMNALLRQQRIHWELLNENLEQLSSVRKKRFDFDGAAVFVQNNPGRIKSTAAEVDKESIEKRECFLCEKNLPEEQKAIMYYKEYNVLCNPFPVFPKHFTVVKKKHVPQSIKEYLNDMLRFSRDTGDEFAVFYNGPQCGASAPDHLHFQAVGKEYLPLYEQVITRNLLKEKPVYPGNKTEITTVSHFGRLFIKVVSRDTVEILNIFSILYKSLQKIAGIKNEPMLNIISFYEKSKWYLIVIPRRKHRPDCFYKEGDERILISPAAIDIAGMLILPREEDFEKINEKTISNIFREVCTTKEINEYLSKKIIQFYG